MTTDRENLPAQRNAGDWPDGIGMRIPCTVSLGAQATEAHARQVPGFTVWAALLQVLVLLPLGALAQTAQVPDLKLGDSWKTEQRSKQTGLKEADTERVITMIGGEMVEGTENGAKFAMTRELNFVETPSVSQSGQKRLSFPLEVGKQWSYSNNWVMKTGSTRGREQLDVKVVANEKVTVPAGEFEAFKIEAKGYWNNDTARTNGRHSRIYWYAPAAKAVVKYENDDGYNRWIQELTELKLQP